MLVFESFFLIKPLERCCCWWWCCCCCRRTIIAPQVNELTDELKMSLDKLHEAETELKKFSRSTSNSQLLPKTNAPSRKTHTPCTFFFSHTCVQLLCLFFRSVFVTAFCVELHPQFRSKLPGAWICSALETNSSVKPSFTDFGLCTKYVCTCSLRSPLLALERDIFRSHDYVLVLHASTRKKTTHVGPFFAANIRESRQPLGSHERLTSSTLPLVSCRVVSCCVVLCHVTRGITNSSILSPLATGGRGFQPGRKEKYVFHVFPGVAESAQKA